MSQSVRFYFLRCLWQRRQARGPVYLLRYCPNFRKPPCIPPLSFLGCYFDTSPRTNPPSCFVGFSPVPSFRDDLATTKSLEFLIDSVYWLLTVQAASSEDVWTIVCCKYCRRTLFLPPLFHTLDLQYWMCASPKIEGFLILESWVKPHFVLLVSAWGVARFDPMIFKSLS